MGGIVKYINSLEDKNHNLLSFQGDITDISLDNILKLVENKLNGIEKNVKVKKKVFKIVVEMVQNIYHHYSNFSSIQQEETFQPVKFTLDKYASSYVISASNYVSNSVATTLKEKIDKINAMNGEQLRAAYLKKLMRGRMSRQGGAGLGMIDIVRNSESKLTYSFEKVGNKNAIFSLSATVHS